MNFYDIICFFLIYILKKKELLKRLNVAKKVVNVEKLNPLGCNIAQPTKKTI